MSTPATEIRARRLIDGTGSASEGWVRVSQGFIIDRGTGPVPDNAPGSPPVQLVEQLTPGLVDIHVHGAAGVDFTDLGADPRPALDYHHGTGATTVVASLATAPHPVTRDRIAELVPFVASGDLAGLHLEGPWLSPRRCGAHAPQFLRAFDPRDLADLLEAGAGTVRMVTVAPEMPGGLEAVRALVAHCVVAAIGHTDADAETVQRAVDAGASVVTHLFNGMPSFHHRTPGPVGAALTSTELALELIGDGLHVEDTVIDLVLTTASDRTILVSDAMAATGLGDGRYNLAGSQVEVRGNVARLADGSSLAGSTTSLGSTVDRLLERGLPAEVLVRAATATPSTSLNLMTPALRIGDRADLRILDFSGRSRTMRSGQWLDSSR